MQRPGLERADMAKAKLTPKQEQFCQEYLIDLNATQAYIRAGYAKKNADVAASRLLVNVKVEARIQELKAKRAERVEVNQDQVLQEYILLGFSDIKNYFRVDEDGELFIKSFEDMPPEYSRVIESIQQFKIDIYDKRTGEITATRTQLKVKLWDKHKALDMVARHTGGFVEKKIQENTGEITHTVKTYHELKEMANDVNDSNNRIKEHINWRSTISWNVSLW